MVVLELLFCFQTSFALARLESNAMLRGVSGEKESGLLLVASELEDCWIATGRDIVGLVEGLDDMLFVRSADRLVLSPSSVMHTTDIVVTIGLSLFLVDWSSFLAFPSLFLVDMENGWDIRRIQWLSE